MNKFKGKAIAGTAVASYGWSIIKEKVVHHYSKTHTTATPEFSELVGVEMIRETWLVPIFNTEEVSFTYQRVA